MANTAPIVTSAVESQSAPIRSQTGLALGWLADGASTHDSSSGSARRSAAEARSMVLTIGSGEQAGIVAIGGVTLARQRRDFTRLYGDVG
jgi:hypothetical protein